MWLYSLVCVGPGREPQRPFFSDDNEAHILSYGQHDRLRKCAQEFNIIKTKSIFVANNKDADQKLFGCPG